MNSQIYLSFFVFLLCVSVLKAQDKQPNDYSIAQIDSLLSMFKKEKAYDKILLYAQVGANKATKLYGKQDTTYAKMIYFMGFGCYVKKDFSNAEKYYQQAIDIQKIKIAKSPDYAKSLNSLAVLYNDMDNYPLAEPIYKEVIKIRKEILGEKHPDYASSLHNLAVLYHTTSNYDSAKNLYEESMKIRKEVLGVKHPDYVKSLNNLAVLHKNMGNYDTELGD